MFSRHRLWWYWYQVAIEGRLNLNSKDRLPGLNTTFHRTALSSESNLGMGRKLYSLWGILLATFAYVDKAVAGQLPLLGNDITKHSESLNAHTIATSSANGEVRRYPFSLGLLRELQVRFPYS